MNSFLVPWRASQSAPCGPSTKSFGITRKKVLKPCVCRVPFEADGVIMAMPAAE